MTNKKSFTIIEAMGTIILVVVIIGAFFNSNSFPQPAPVIPNKARFIKTDTTNFNSNLGAGDTDVQTALETLDDMIGGGNITGGLPNGTSSEIQIYSNATAFGYVENSTYDPNTNMLSVNNLTANNLTLTNALPVAQGGTGATALTDLIALKTHTTGNYVESVATTAPLTGGAAASEGSTLTIAIPKSASGVDGYLNGTDFDTFNGKQGALTNSAGLAAALSDETGTASGTPLAVFNQNPTIAGATVTGVVDAGGATDFEIENGANPTVDTAGEVSVDTSATSGSGLRFYGDAEYTLPAYQFKSFTITNATATADRALIQVPFAVTIRNVSVVALTGTNIVGQLTECDSDGRAASCVVVDSSDITATSTTSFDDGTLSNPSIDAKDFIGWNTTSVSETVNATITFAYTVDAVN